MNAILPSAVSHLKTYPIDTLDMTTLRHLRDECAGWLKIMDGIRSGMLDRPEALAHWDDVFSEDVEQVKATQATIAAFVTHLFKDV